MSYQITDLTKGIIDQTKQRASIFLRVAADNVVSISTPNTPMKEGNLRRDVIKSVTGLHGEVEWRKVYASPQEAGNRSGIPFRKYTTPGTGPHFAENAIKEVSNRTGTIAKLSHLI